MESGGRVRVPISPTPDRGDRRQREWTSAQTDDTDDDDDDDGRRERLGTERRRAKGRQGMDGADALLPVDVGVRPDWGMTTSTGLARPSHSRARGTGRRGIRDVHGMLTRDPETP